jgi:hypothetical protein
MTELIEFKPMKKWRIVVYLITSKALTVIKLGTEEEIFELVETWTNLGMDETIGRKRYRLDEGSIVYISREIIK